MGEIMQATEFYVCPSDQDYPVCYELDDGYCYQLLDNKMNYKYNTFKMQRVRTCFGRQVNVSKERIVRQLQLWEIKVIAALAWIPIDELKYIHGIPANDLQCIKQKISDLFESKGKNNG